MLERFSLDKFAQHSFYQEINWRLVKITGLRPGQKVIDLGAGTGAVTRLLVAAVAGDKGEVIAVEPSESALEGARRNLQGLQGACVRFVQGRAERLSQLVRRPVDAVVFSNAIHLVREKARAVQEVYRTLPQGGTFSFSTTFFQGADPPETEQFYRRWMMKALRTLKARYGLMPARAEKVLARRPLSVAQYVSLLEEAGFQVRQREIVPVDMTLKAWEDLSEYSLAIEGIMPGVPLEVASEALKVGVRETFAELGLKSTPRNWLLMVSSK